MNFLPKNPIDLSSAIQSHNPMFQFGKKLLKEIRFSSAYQAFENAQKMDGSGQGTRATDQSSSQEQNEVSNHQEGSSREHNLQLETELELIAELFSTRLDNDDDDGLEERESDEDPLVPLWQATRSSSNSSSSSSSPFPGGGDRVRIEVRSTQPSGQAPPESPSGSLSKH